jgi:hypothetical protein
MGFGYIAQNAVKLIVMLAPVASGAQGGRNTTFREGCFAKGVSRRAFREGRFAKGLHCFNVAFNDGSGSWLRPMYIRSRAGSCMCAATASPVHVMHSHSQLHLFITHPAQLQWWTLSHVRIWAATNEVQRCTLSWNWYSGAEVLDSQFKRK